MNTSKLLNEIATMKNIKIIKGKLFNSFNRLKNRDAVNKTFYDSYYEQTMGHFQTTCCIRNLIEPFRSAVEKKKLSAMKTFILVGVFILILIVFF